MKRPETRYAKSRDGASLAYQIVGDGPGDIGYMPPLGSIDLVWDEPTYAHFLERLSRLGRVICADPPRMQGAQERRTLGPSTWEQVFDDTAAGLSAAGSERAVLVVEGVMGMGGVLWAATFPDKTEALVLINSCARWLRDDGYPGAPEHVLVRTLDLIEQSWGTGLVGRLFAPSLSGDDTFIEWHGRVERLIHTPASARALIEWVMREDVRAVLPSVHVPTLVLHRTGNGIVRPELGRYMAEHIRGSKYVELPGVDYVAYGADVDPLVDEIEEFLGVRPAPASDRILATVLFTDIVSSTERIASIGDRHWSDVLDQHNRIVDRLISEFRGRHVDSAGDGVLATFDGPARAIRCACEIRDQVGKLGLVVRAGLHTGEIELAGDDVRGMGVHIGHRISALAGPGEVLVSRTVTDLVAGSGLAFETRGEHKLKGVPGEWTVYAVMA